MEWVRGFEEALVERYRGYSVKERGTGGFEYWQKGRETHRIFAVCKRAR